MILLQKTEIILRFKTINEWVFLFVQYLKYQFGYTLAHYIPQLSFVDMKKLKNNILI